ISNTIR
ncbi:hypothetical protein MK533_03280, partial [Streptococcus agalactiae]|nr:hypothetical protein [Streptococcus agalactiae]